MFIPILQIVILMVAVGCSLFSMGVLLCEIRLNDKRERGYYDE